MFILLQTIILHSSKHIVLQLIRLIVVIMEINRFSMYFNCREVALQPLGTVKSLIEPWERKISHLPHIPQSNNISWPRSRSHVYSIHIILQLFDHLVVAPSFPSCCYKHLTPSGFAVIKIFEHWWHWCYWWIPINEIRFTTDCTDCHRWENYSDYSVFNIIGNRWSCQLQIRIFQY